ncbi:MAG: VOC family protein [Limisphaerales bacterium]
MTTTGMKVVQPYLFFDGKCEEALNFYKKALGAEIIAMMRFKDSPDPGHTVPGGAEKIMHASFKIGGSEIMASDGCNGGKTEFKGFALSIAVSTGAEADQYFAALSEGGQVQMPLEKTFYAEKFGMVADKFGVGWMIIAGPVGG